MRIPSWLAQHLAALRALLVFTVLVGLAYPLVIAGVAQIPGLQEKADGSLVKTADGKSVGSRLIGQSFIDADGEPMSRYFQSRPSAAGSTGYDPTATSASNLGPESVVDTLGDPSKNPNSEEGDGSKTSLLTQVCARSKAVGELEGVDGRRAYCTPGGVGAVLAVFRENGLTGKVTRVVSLNETATSYDETTKSAKTDDSVRPFLSEYQGVPVELAVFGEDYTKGVITPIRGGAPATPVVPADAITASASGLDPHISPAYAKLQAARVAKARGVDPAAIQQLIERFTTGRALGFMGEPAVNVLELNLDLDRQYPLRG